MLLKSVDLLANSCVHVIMYCLSFHKVLGFKAIRTIMIIVWSLAEGIHMTSL